MHIAVMATWFGVPINSEWRTLRPVKYAFLQGGQQ
jgi:hypothetical protein